MGLKVLHVVHAFRPGGMENMIAQMAHRMADYGITIGVCALTHSGEFCSRLPGDAEVFQLGKKGGLDWCCAMALRRLIARLNPAVVHSHNWNGLLYSTAAVAGTGRPVLQGEHAQFYAWERTPWRLRMRAALYSQCDLIHTVSQGQAAELLQLGLSRRSPVKVICNGVDSEKFRPQPKSRAREILGIKPDGFYLGMVARCVPEKRHNLLLEAFELLAVSHPGISLVLAGAGGNCEESVKRQISRHRYAGRIVWLGHRDDMPNVYNALDLLVLPSEAEGMSNVCLEAMSCGTPVLVNGACGADELVVSGHTGMIERMISSEDVCHAVKALLDRPDVLQNMGGAARLHIERHHRLADTAENYAKTYHTLAGRVRPD